MYKRTIFSILISILFIPNILFAQSTNDITLKPGFNFVSLTNLITLTPTELKTLNTSIEDVFLYSSSAGSFLSASEGTLSSLSAGKGYIIKSNASSDIKISITGNAITTITPLNLKTGFNLVGFSQTPTPLTFEKLMTDNTIIKGCYKWSPAAGSFIQVLRDELGAITKIDGVDPTIKAGEAYFLYLYSDTILTYDTTLISLTPSTFDLPTPKVANPVISPTGGNILSSKKISLSCATEGSTIYYKIDDDSPTLYTEPFSISNNCTIKVTASKVGWTNSDLVTSTFILIPELEITGTLPTLAINSSNNSLNHSAALGINGHTILVVRADSENSEIGTINISSTEFIASIPIDDKNFTALIIIKDNLGRILFRNILGKTLTKSELPLSTKKIRVTGINIDSISTALSLLVKEKNIEVGKIIPSISSTDLQNGVATKTSTISSEISRNFSSNPSIINEVAKAINTVNTIVLSTNVSINTVPSNISTATELLTSFVNVIKENKFQTIIMQNQLATSIMISPEQKIDSSTINLEPILKVKAPSFTIRPGIYNTNQKLAITCPTQGAIIKYTTDGTIPSVNNGLIYNSTLSIELSTVIKTIAIKADLNDSDVVTGIYTILPKVAAPVISPESCLFNPTQEVNIKCSTIGATIKYTTNGTVPSVSNGMIYNNSIIIFSTTLIKAIAIKAGMTDSDIINSTYTKVDKVALPQFNSTNLPGETTHEITISCATEGTTIYYTTNGSTPSISSTKYTGSLLMSETTTIKAIATKDNLVNSDVANFTFIKMEKVATPKITPPDGSFSSSQNITISTTTLGATIKYTIDGSIPTLTNGLIYVSPINISKTTTIKSIAIKKDMLDSNLTSATINIYTINFSKISPTSNYQFFDSRTEFASLSYNNKMWVIGGTKWDNSNYNDVWYSSDGCNWNKATENAQFGKRSFLKAFVYNNKMWVYGGITQFNTTIDDLWNSNDGINWVKISRVTTIEGKKKYFILNDIIYMYSNNSGNVSIWQSIDGENWIKVGDNPNTTYQDSDQLITFKNYLYLINYPLKRSSDGINWETISTSISYDGQLTGTVFNDKLWLITTNQVWYSDNGINWIKINSNFNRYENYKTGITCNNNLWLINYQNQNYKYKNRIYNSTDGINWNESQIILSQSNALFQLNNKIWYNNFNHGMMCSSDLDKWFRAKPDYSCHFFSTYINFNNKVYEIGGNTDQHWNYKGQSMNHIFSTTDGINWNYEENNFGLIGNHSCVVFNNKIFAIGGRTDEYNRLNSVLCSTNGNSWEIASLNAEFSPRHSAACTVYDNKIWIFGGIGTNGYMKDVWNSTDGIKWNLIQDNILPQGQNFDALIYDNKIFLITNEGMTKSIIYTTDGINFFNIPFINSYASRFKSIVYNNKILIFENNNIWSSQ